MIVPIFTFWAPTLNVQMSVSSGIQVMFDSKIIIYVKF